MYSRVPPTDRRSERGMLLYAMLVVVFMMGMVSMVFSQVTQTGRLELQRHEADLRSLEIAEVGLQRAELEILTDTDPAGDGIGVVSGTFGGGTYLTEAVLVDVDHEVWKVVSRGEHGHSRRTLEVALRLPNRSLFQDAVFADGPLGVTGSTAASDAYDSRLGEWSLQATHYDGMGVFAETGGHLGGNAAIDVGDESGWIMIRGDAIPGPLDATTIEEDSTVTGATTPRAASRVLPATRKADFEAAIAANNNSEVAQQALPGSGISYDGVTYSVQADGSGVILTLTGGTYFFRDLRIVNGAVLKVSAASVIYCTGVVNLGGNGVNTTTKKPPDLLFYVHPYPLPVGAAPTATSVRTTGGVYAAFGVYAPAVDAEIVTGSHIYGAFVCRNVAWHGPVQIHYDRALREVLAPPGTLNPERLYWLEPVPPR